jgi:hypothetical protein
VKKLLADAKQAVPFFWITRILEFSTVLFSLLWAAEAYAEKISLRNLASVQEENRLEGPVKSSTALYGRTLGLGMTEKLDNRRKNLEPPKILNQDTVSHTLQANPYFGEVSREALRF